MAFLVFPVVVVIVCGLLSKLFSGFPGPESPRPSAGARRIAEYEKWHGLSPVGWRIGKLGCDIHGLFWERPDGTRRRDV